MTTRIKELLEAKGLSSSGFADAIGVPRSTISHILSGRNKPSLDLVQKILDAFPDVRTEWIVRGRGGMVNETPDLFSQVVDAKRTTAPHGEAMGMAGSDAASVGEQRRPAPARDDDGPFNVPDTHRDPAEKLDEQRIVQVITFYSDHTFTVHYPRQLAV